MLIIDGHVHIYDQFELSRFFVSAVANFAGAARSLRAITYQSVMFLADWPDKNWFETLRGLCQSAPAPGRGDLSGFFRFETTRERSSLIVKGKGLQPIVVIAARKIVTAEKLEVMALFSSELFPMGSSLSDTLDLIRQHEAVAVIPWAVGKWLGRRGRRVNALLNSHGHHVWLADNANRPWFWPRPRQFSHPDLGKSGLLAGSDPLDLASEVDRAGCFGFAIDGHIDDLFPARQVKGYLCGNAGAVVRYGELETGFRFVRNQVAIRLAKKAKEAMAGTPESHKR